MVIISFSIKFNTVFEMNTILYLYRDRTSLTRFKIMLKNYLKLLKPISTGTIAI
jgi:hypothetical protein